MTKILNFELKIEGLVGRVAHAKFSFLQGGRGGFTLCEPPKVFCSNFYRQLISD